MNHKEKCTISLSIEKGILQHDIYSWQVLRDDLIKSDALTDASETISETLTTWLDNTTNEQRKIFFDGIFELVYSTDATTFGDIPKDLSNNIMKISRKYKQISEEDKKTITEMLKIFVKYYFNIAKEKEETKFGAMKERYKKEGKKLMEEIDEKYLRKMKKSSK